MRRAGQLHLNDTKVGESGKFELQNQDPRKSHRSKLKVMEFSKCEVLHLG